MTGLPLHLIHQDIDRGKLKSLLCRERIHTYVVEEAELNHWLRLGSEPISPEAKELVEDIGWTLPRAAKFVGLAYEIILNDSLNGELQTREIPHFFLGKRRLVAPEDLLKWLIRHPVPYRKEVAHLEPVADIQEAARRSGRTLQSVSVCIREGSPEAWGKQIPRRSLDRWLKKLGLPQSWQPRKEEQWLPIEAFASWSEVDAPTILLWIESGRVLAKKSGNRWLVQRTSFENQRKGAPPARKSLSLKEAAKRSGHSVDHRAKEIREARLTRQPNRAGDLVAEATTPPGHPPWTLALITQRLGIPRAALQQAVGSGALPALARGRSWLVEHSDLEKWMDERSRI